MRVWKQVEGELVSHHRAWASWTLACQEASSYTHVSI